MGCINTLFGSYTAQDIDSEIANLTPRLPVAELMVGGIIKLQGANGFFNPNSLLDPSWLKGKMTPQEYYDAIDYINKSTGYTHIGLSRGYTPAEGVKREQLRVQAGVAAVQKINERHPAVRFTYQQTAGKVQMSTAYSTDPAVHYAQTKSCRVPTSSVTMLYISIP